MSLSIWLTPQEGTDDLEYWANITHNVAPMWRAAGVYKSLYRSEGKRAGELVETLEKGIEDMTANPDKYKALNPANGWGNYEGALDFLREFAKACKDNPLGIVGLSR
jgi:hypothetical protein